MLTETEGESQREVHLRRRLVEDVQYHRSQLEAQADPAVLAESPETRPIRIALNAESCFSHILSSYPRRIHSGLVGSK